jgi:hypothetical protein|tara:strand:- start:301 stop:495 length:195 start_codon:yes stop_codon:yes gene_type:complete
VGECGVNFDTGVLVNARLNITEEDNTGDDWAVVMGLVIEFEEFVEFEEDEEDVDNEEVNDDIAD